MSSAQSMTIDEVMARYLDVAQARPIRFMTGMALPHVPRFRRMDGLVDGGTIEHLDELRAAQRALHDAFDPAWGIL